MPMIRAIMGMLERQQCDVAAFFADVDVDLTRLDDTLARIDRAHYDRIQLAAVACLQDPALGLHMGQATSLSTFGVLGHLLMSAPSMAELCELFFKYHRLISDSEPSSLDLDGDSAILTYRYPVSPNPVCNRIRAEFGLVQVCKIGQHMLGNHIEVQAVHFEHGAPDYAGEVQAFFGAPVRYDEAATRLIFPADILDRQLIHANPAVTQLLEEEAQRQMRRLARATQLAEQLESYLYQQIQWEKPTIAQAARHFAMTERTLRRKLDAQQTSFTHLLNQVQMTLATRLLNDGELPIEAISDQLKFSEPSAFYRAFKRWTGATPIEYRASRA